MTKRWLVLYNEVDEALGLGTESKALLKFKVNLSDGRNLMTAAAPGLRR